MSQFTFATLVKAPTQPIAEFLEQHGASSYLFPANPDWNAVIMKIDKHLDTQSAQKLSETLHTSALYFFNCEDHAWGYSFYHCGQLESRCFVNYEEQFISIQNKNEIAVYEACKDPDTYMSFRQWVKHFDDHLEEIYRGVELFKKAFAIEKIEWISYAYLSRDSDGRREELGARYFRGKKKIIKVKKIIFDTLQNSLNQKGYFLDKSMSDGKRLAFTRKDEHGYTYGIYVDASDKGKISASLYSPSKGYSDLFWVTCKQHRREITYEDEAQLQLVLEEIRDVFVNIGHNWLQNNQIEVFDVNAVYQEIMTPSLEKKGFRKVHEDQPIMFGGKLIYKRDEFTITFKHFPKITRIEVILNAGEGEFDLHLYVHNNRNTPPFNEGLRRVFLNKEEFIEFLEGVMKYLEIYLHHISSK